MLGKLFEMGFKEEDIKRAIGDLPIVSASPMHNTQPMLNGNLDSRFWNIERGHA